MCVCAGVHADINTGVHAGAVDLLQISSTLILETCPLTEPDLLISAAQVGTGMYLALLPGTSIKGTHGHANFSHQYWGSELRFLCYHSKTFAPSTRSSAK